MCVSAKWVILWSLWAARLARQPTMPLRVSGGTVRGNIARDGSHAAYLSIPYATLTEDNRFQAPGPEPTWEDVYDADDDKTMCLQRTLIELSDKSIGREHCLTLNVFTPVFPLEEKLPVMVFIHGGGFIEGSSRPMLYGPNYLVSKGVILVSFNYRLNVQGFLGLGIKEAPGNAGMKDQVAALRWVQRNIRAFGGDPDNVTIFGESAGAVSVSYHLLSPMSEGLFHRAITQSGSSLAGWALQATPEKNARLLAKAMGVKTEDPHELYNIFKNSSPEDLVNVYGKLPKDKKKMLISRLIFAPSVEKEFDGVEPFLTKEPYELLKSGKYKKVPMIIGANDEEGYLFTGLEDPKVYPTIEIEHSLPKNLVFPSESEKKRVAREFQKMYMGDDSISSAKKNYSRFVGESCFNYPSVAETELILESTDKPVYHYLFKYDGWRNGAKFMAGAPFRSYSGAAHADDLFYLFYQAFMFHGLDRKMISKMTSLWTNFAKYGDPTPHQSELLPRRWRPASPGAPEAFVIDRQFSTIPLWHRDSLKFWKNVYSKYRGIHT